MRHFKRAVCFTLALIIMVPVMAFGDYSNGANADGLILTDPVDNTYIGRPHASTLIEQLQFTDLPANPAHQDAIIRAGARLIMRPDGRQFNPNAPITNEEALIYVLRLTELDEGELGETAMALGIRLADDLPPNTPLDMVLSLGYLELAAIAGLISEDDVSSARGSVAMLINLPDADAEADEDAPPLPIIPTAFDRTANATREDVARWLFGALQRAHSDVSAPITRVSLQSFSDWQSISPEAAAGVEFLVRNNIMNGQTSAVFGPTGTVTRLEMAQIARTLEGWGCHDDDCDFILRGHERRVGTVADITNEHSIMAGGGTTWRYVHIRRDNGNAEQLRFTYVGGTSTQAGALDAVVLRNGVVAGLNSLQPGDAIEYIVHPEEGTVWYVNVTSQTQTQTFRGRLEIINMDEGTMTFRNLEDTIFTFPMSAGLHGTGHDGVPFIRFPGNELRPAASLPRGSFYDVTLVGNVITALEFVGDPVVIPENRGLVIENNPFVGYITILDANRNEISFTYNPAQLRVQRRQFFDMRDTIGGLHEMFPSVRPHPREADMSDVIAGDIVVFRTANDDPFRIIELSAAENTTTRYGRILEIRDQGGYFDMLMEFENGQTTWYTFVYGILVMENGRPVSPNRIQLGDWARITVNQAFLAPGVMMESIRDISLDTGGHHINSIVTGQLSGFNPSQNLLQVRNARELTPAGWSNNRPMASFDISGPNVRYYFNGRPVTLAHVNRYLQRSDATVYMAIENHFAGERAVMVSFRTGRDELVRAGTILGSTNNSFQMLEAYGSINTDDGTIVVRNGRLVEQQHIYAPDWARVSLNGPSTAAVVNITPPPSTAGVQIVRGRVAQVWPFDSFRVETVSLFDGFRWNFTPVSRQFTIDHDTIFINEGGVTSIDSFLGFTDDSVIGDVFNIVVEGGRAVRVIDAPFTEPIPPIASAPGHLTVRGIIYATDGTNLSLRDMTVYNPNTGEWSRFSNINPTGVVNTFANTVIVDRDQVIPASRLQVGQQIIAFTPTRLDDDGLTIEPGFTADAYIVLVEN
ncbi:MAG: S-layer homology domain-containing protein [Defluviitaleaceae bacterium]|nr:S-layer homology domain-containing protein [Defluviitaleaceae bacterium]